MSKMLKRLTILAAILVFAAILIGILMPLLKHPAQKTAEKAMEYVSLGKSTEAYELASDNFKSNVTKAQWDRLVKAQEKILKSGYKKVSFEKKDKSATERFSTRIGNIDYQFTIEVKKVSDKWELQFFNAKYSVIPIKSNDK